MSRFDERIDRHGTNSLKWDAAEKRHIPTDAIPMWVADMDFRAPDEVLQALTDAVKHGIFGYSDTDDAYAKAVCDWFKKRFHADLRAEWIVKTPGIVFAINAAIRAFTKPGESVLIQEPVYYPFARSIKNNDRRIVNNELVYRDGTYTINFEELETLIIKEEVKLMILCSPHNPVGRVWTKEELLQIADICLRHQVFIVSDEIHCDFTGERFPHTVFSTLSEQAADNCMVCTSPSKTFNLAGLQISNNFVPNESRRIAFAREVAKTGYDECNLMGIVACRAAYQSGEPWLDELKTYLEGNIDYVRGFLREHLPMLKLVEPQGTYLLWVDCSGLSLSDTELNRFIAEKAGLWLDGGSMFGKASGQFQRFNIACPRSLLEEALEKLAKAVNELRGD